MRRNARLELDVDKAKARGFSVIDRADGSRAVVDNGEFGFIKMYAYAGANGNRNIWDWIHEDFRK